MAVAATTIKAGGAKLKRKAPRLPEDASGRVKYEATTEDGVLVIVYVPAAQARKTLSAVGLKLTGPKAVQASAPEADDNEADDLV